jgi:hypothetical protein
MRRGIRELAQALGRGVVMAGESPGISRAFLEPISEPPISEVRALALTKSRI